MPASATDSRAVDVFSVPGREVPTEGPARRAVDEARRRELGTFLRSRRERTTPDQVGLPPGGRRRTPGLRREEVATLAGVGVTWYTWLEQGRDIRPSAQVLESIARTLLFDPHERAHLLLLGGVTDTATDQDIASLPPGVLAMLDQLDPFPACVSGPRYDLLAYNRAYNSLIADLDAMPFEERNTLWLIFTHPAWRNAILELDDVQRRLVAQLRSNMAEHVGEPAWKCLVRRLSEASPDFVRVWQQHDVSAPENRTKRLMTPRWGLLSLDYTSLYLGARSGVRLVTYTPADQATALRLQHMKENREAA
jgi:transcriptional regulator with XRE-family HTH domain